MSLFGALSELVGGAVLASAPACDLALPADIVEQRAKFVSWLTGREELREFKGMVEAVGREIWVGNETKGLAQLELEQHIRSAAELINDHPPSASLLAEIASAMRTGLPPSMPMGETVSNRIAYDLIGRARLAGAFGGTALREEVILFLLDKSFSQLSDNPRALALLGPALADFAHEQGASISVSGGHDAISDLASLGISRAFQQRIANAGGATMLNELRERHGLADRAVRRLVALVDGQPIDTDARIDRLDELAAWLGEVCAQLTRPTNDTDDMRRLKAAAAAALAEGDFEAAMEALRQVRQELRESRRRTEERLQDEAAALRTQMLEESRTAARLAELLQARGEHSQAAELFAEATMALPRTDRDSAWRLNQQRANALLQHARERGDAGALGEALNAFGQLVQSAIESTKPLALGEACLGHGDALFAVSERESDSNRLKDAISIYEKAVQLFERENDKGWLRRGRIALARALARLGERDDSVEDLRVAAQAFRDAAALIANDRQSDDQAIVKMGLGSVLLAIEEREGGAPVLLEAVDAYSAALAVLDREIDAERWGEAQMNIGLAMLGLGEQENNASRLEKAVGAFRSALEVTPRVKAPQRWALTQMNLGNALAALGDRDPVGTARLDEAIAAYHVALEELVREVEPLKWAITQMNLGTALIRLGERQERRRNWLAAAATLVPALEVFEEQGADHLAEMTRRNLKRFQDSWDSFLAPPQAQQQPQPADRHHQPGSSVPAPTAPRASEVPLDRGYPNPIARVG